MRILTAALLLLALALPALAVEPDEMLDDPALEARAREISRDLRCLVCQNQSIDDSNAELARDLRLLVRERLAEGDTNEEVLDYVVSRYGDYVLLDPPVKDTTYVLWFGPVVIVVFGALAVGLVFRRNRRTARGNGSTAGKPGPMPGLSEAERRRIQKLLDDEDA